MQQFQETLLKHFLTTICLHKEHSQLYWLSETPSNLTISNCYYTYCFYFLCVSVLLHDYCGSEAQQSLAKPFVTWWFRYIVHLYILEIFAFFWLNEWSLFWKNWETYLEVMSSCLHTWTILALGIPLKDNTSD